MDYCVLQFLDHRRVIWVEKVTGAQNHRGMLRKNPLKAKIAMHMVDFFRWRPSQREQPETNVDIDLRATSLQADDYPRRRAIKEHALGLFLKATGHKGGYYNLGILFIVHFLEPLNISTLRINSGDARMVLLLNMVLKYGSFESVRQYFPLTPGKSDATARPTVPLADRGLTWRLSPRQAGRAVEQGSRHEECPIPEGSQPWADVGEIHGLETRHVAGIPPGCMGLGESHPVVSPQSSSTTGLLVVQFPPASPNTKNSSRP